MKLEDIAKLAGVSRSTVSRVINNQPNVRPTTRQKVLRVIREQKFRPNLVARALVTRQTQTLSLVIPQRVGAVFSDPYFPTLIQSVIFEANRNNYAVMLWIGDNVEEETSFCQRILDNGFFDGILVASAIDNDPLIPRLVEVGFPFVLIGPPPVDNLNYVDIDNVSAAKEAVTHFITLGRQRIGMLAGPLNMPASRDRVQGYREALEAAGRCVEDSLVIEGDFDRPSGYSGMKTLMERGVDAVFAANDTMAAGALQAIVETGRRVPEDIGIIGFDDLPIATEITPPLTTVRQPIDQLGGQAARILIDVVTGARSSPTREILPTWFIVRESCGSS